MSATHDPIYGLTHNVQLTLGAIQAYLSAMNPEMIVLDLNNVPGATAPIAMTYDDVLGLCAALAAASGARLMVQDIKP